jgi:transposase InsO family protein
MTAKLSMPKGTRNLITNPTQRRYQCLWSNHGGEITSCEFTEFLQEQRTELCLTTSNTPQHNGVAKSINRQLLECVWPSPDQPSERLIGRNHTFCRGVKRTAHTQEFLVMSYANLANVPEWGRSVWVYL